MQRPSTIYEQRRVRARQIDVVPLPVQRADLQRAELQRVAEDVDLGAPGPGSLKLQPPGARRDRRARRERAAIGEEANGGAAKDEGGARRDRGGARDREELW